MTYYVAVVNTDKEGRNRYLLDSIMWTTDIQKAFTWDDLDICKLDLKDLKKSWGIDAKPLKVKQSN